MDVRVLSDSNWEAKLAHVTDVLDLSGYFEERFYGTDLAAIVIVLNCRARAPGHRQRIRRNKKSKTLYVDVMLQLGEFVGASHEARRKLVASNVGSEVPAALARFRFSDFASPKFARDLKSALKAQLLGPEASRLDASRLP
jgi:hypothetical protein